MDKVIIGSRGSVLALWQANFVKKKLENNFNLNCEIKIVKTTGDKILDAPLAKIGGKGLFTKELEELLLSGDITIAVHSLKDVPIDINKGLVLSSITEREDRRDCFLSNQYEDINKLPLNAKVGTTSLRRAMQLKYIRNDIKTISLRGNVQTRLDKLRNGDFDAIILANAGVKRLGITNNDINYILPLNTDIMLPAMGQGALGIECREDCHILDNLRLLNNNLASIECGIERKFVKMLDGGCQIPLGVSAFCENENIKVDCIIGLPNGKEIIRDNVFGNKNDDLATKLYEKIKNKNALDLLQRALLMIDSINAKIR